MKRGYKDDCAKIDFVIPWVDGNDPAWLEEKSKYDGTVTSKNANSAQRFRDWENLRYWFRGVEKYAPWVNKIHFITWGHVPDWLDTNNPKINIVKHTDFIPSQYLPTYNSHTIELNMHRIKGLSEHFVYFNDDLFLINPTEPELFFKNGLPCDTFALDAIYFGPDSAGHFIGNDIEVINKNFSIKKQLKKIGRNKVYNLKYGLKTIIKTCFLSHFPWFTSFKYDHLVVPYRKSTFFEVWKKEFEILNGTCLCKFRSKNQVNQWVMKFWQLASGDFVPRKPVIGKVFHLKKYPQRNLTSYFRTSKDYLICLNDTLKTRNWELHKARIINLFNEKLPEKCSFEKNCIYPERTGLLVKQIKNQICLTKSDGILKYFYEFNWDDIENEKNKRLPFLIDMDDEKNKIFFFERNNNFAYVIFSTKKSYRAYKGSIDNFYKLLFKLQIRSYKLNSNVLVLVMNLVNRYNLPHSDVVLCSGEKQIKKIKVCESSVNLMKVEFFNKNYFHFIRFEKNLSVDKTILNITFEVDGVSVVLPLCKNLF